MNSELRSRDVAMATKSGKCNWPTQTSFVAFRNALEDCIAVGDTRISYLFDKYSPASGALSPRPEALDPVDARPQTLCIGLKSRARHACNDCINLLP